HLFYGALGVLECTTIERVLALGVDRTKIDMTARRPHGGAPSTKKRRASVTPDLASGTDLLDVSDEVEAMCAVVAAHDTTPPLSIGLFGDWGTGKSFFMSLMEERINELKKV